MQSCGVEKKPKLRVWIWSFELARFLLAIVFLTGIGGVTQSPHPEINEHAVQQRVPEWQRAAGSEMRFEVASVRPSDPESKAPGNVALDSSDYFLYQGGPVRLRGLLTSYIFFAYKLNDFAEYNMLSAALPNWAQKQEFVIEARTSGSPTKDQIRVMVQNLLAERFGLRMHTEIREMPIYALVLERPGKPGPGLTAHPDDQLCTKMPDKDAPKPKDGLPPYCGSIAWPDNGLTHLRIMDYTMDQISGELMRDAFWLGGLDSRPVVDRTGLDGKWDLNVRFLQPRRGQAAAGSEADTPAPGFLDALRRDAGLKLVSETGPVVTYVVDAVHPPSEN